MGERLIRASALLSVEDEKSAHKVHRERAGPGKRLLERSLSEAYHEGQTSPEAEEKGARTTTHMVRQCQSRRGGGQGRTRGVARLLEARQGHPPRFGATPR